MPLQAQRDRLDGAGRQRVGAIHPQFDTAWITQPHVAGTPEHHRFDVPPAMIDWDGYLPPKVVNSTQQSCPAARRMTTSWA